MQPSPSLDPYVVVQEIVLAQWNAGAISAVAKLGVADQVESGAKTTTELASLLNVHEDSLYRVMRALAGLGIFREGENRTFSQTPRSDVLRTSAKPSLRYAATMMVDDWQAGSVRAMATTIESGAGRFRRRNSVRSSIERSIAAARSARSSS